jgi:hypothetical protein
VYCLISVHFRNPDGSPFIIPRSHPTDVNVSLFRALSFILARDVALPINSFLPAVLLSVADHLSDLDTAQAITAMAKRHNFSPTSAEWIDTWTSVLSNHDLHGTSKAMTRRAIMDVLRDTHTSVKDIPAYRRSLVELVFYYWKRRNVPENEGDETEAVWLILGDEIVLRIAEASSGSQSPNVDVTVEEILVFLTEVSISPGYSDENGTSSTIFPEPQPPSTPTAFYSTGVPTASPSPISSQMQSEGRGQRRERQKAMPSVMSLLTSFATGHSSRSQSQHPKQEDGMDISEQTSSPALDDSPPFTSAVGAVISLVLIFSHLVFTSHAIPDSNLRLAIRVYDILLRTLATSPCSSARLTVLQFLMRLRADRDHKLYYASDDSIREGHLMSLFNQLQSFGCASEGMASYDPTTADNETILPLSRYLSTIIDVLEGAEHWEILSYVLCHLPVQLANKHLFCGPKCRALMVQLLKTLCGGILQGKLAANIQSWPNGLKARDALGLAYYSLSVLISYKHCFDGQLLHALVEVLLEGLSGQPLTIKCCLHALSLSAFELQPSMKKYLPKILEKLSQIMSNQAMAVQIINFLSIVGSLQTLHANFTEGDFKTIFGVALQYLQQHNRPDSVQTISWALSQHVRIMSYYIVYVWFLAVRLPDRPRHIAFITRQLLLANEGKNEVDQPTEVCFDWLARYTYATADPRPTNSFLNETVMNPRTPYGPAIAEKTWIVGNSVVTIRTLSRLGWMEVLSRRASGLTKFLCRVENVPMVGPGDVNPDMLSVPVSLMVDRSWKSESSEPEASVSVTHLQPQRPNVTSCQQIAVTDSISTPDVQPENESRPDPITGYVWSGSAPSQRRKEVLVDPAFFALQLSPYSDHRRPYRGVLVTDEPQLKNFVRTLDRMPVIDTHKVGIMYVAPGQSYELEILRNTHGSPAYHRFLEGIGRLINLRGQADVYAGGLDPDEDGEYAYAWWDDNSQILYHTATMMPNDVSDEFCNNKKRHIGNDFVRIVWNDSGKPYRFDTLATQFQFVNIVVEPHSRGAIAAFSDNVHENEYFKVTVQRAPGMTEFTPIGDFKLISADNLSLLVRQLSLLSDWFASVFQTTERDTQKIDVVTNWGSRLDTIQRFKTKMSLPNTSPPIDDEDIMSQQNFRDFSASY